MPVVPDVGTIESSVLFFVSVAADVFTLEYDIVFFPPILLYLDLLISQATHGSI